MSFYFQIESPIFFVKIIIIIFTEKISAKTQSLLIITILIDLLVIDDPVIVY